MQLFGMNYRRVTFRQVKPGMLLWNRTAGDMGTVKEVVIDKGGVRAVVMKSGIRMTRSGWASRKLWTPA